jgi:hypothetical protein
MQLPWPPSPVGSTAGARAPAHPRLPQAAVPLPPGVTLTAYCGARILCERTDEHTEVLKFYREPDPEPMGPLAAIVPTIAINKLIFMAPHPRSGSRLCSLTVALTLGLSGACSLAGCLVALVGLHRMAAALGA